MGHHVHAHAHPLPGEGARKRLLVVLVVILGFLAGEVAVGVVAHSLALLSDAGHMLADALAIGLSLLAIRLAARPAGGALTFGLRRVEILSAQANGVMLVILAAFVVYAAIGRLVHPPHVRAALVLAAAGAGIAVNLLATAILAGADRRSLNVEGTFQHILTDLYGFLGTALAAGTILASGFQRADPIVSLLIATLMVRSGWGLLRASGRVFLEASPQGLDPEAIGEALVAVGGVVEVHDLHVWEVTSGFPALSAHVLVAADRDCHEARREMESLLHERFSLEHTTLQVDHAGAPLIELGPPGSGASWR